MGSSTIHGWPSTLPKRFLTSAASRSITAGRSLIKEDDLIAGAVIRDLETGSELLSGNSAIMVPHTPDGRVLFAVPWHDHVVVGTTDMGVDTISLEPVPMDEEIGFILTNAAKYLSKAPSRSDVLSVYAGLRPLVKVGDSKGTAALSRDHTILISNARLLTIRRRQMDDLSQDGPRRRRASGDHGRVGGTPLQNRAFADPWLDQAGHPGAKLAPIRCRRAPDS